MEVVEMMEAAEMTEAVEMMKAVRTPGWTEHGPPGHQTPRAEHTEHPPV
jgi:hypothetical protein